MTGRHAAPASPLPYPNRPVVVQAQWWERLPSPLPPLLGLMAGILLGFGSSWGWPLAALGLVVTGLSRRYWLLPLVLLAGLLGQWREQTWEHAPNVLAGYIGDVLKYIW